MLLLYTLRSLLQYEMLYAGWGPIRLSLAGYHYRAHCVFVCYRIFFFLHNAARLPTRRRVRKQLFAFKYASEMSI